jgi:TfoX/Sxy family transcriptional regulator of competence genes
MAFSEELAERIRQGLARRKGIEEKKMFGGIGFLLNGNLLVGVWKESLILKQAKVPRSLDCRRSFC